MTARQQLILIAAGTAIIGFALGALWQYGSGRTASRQLAEIRHEHAFTSLEATLGAATIEAQRGSHEISRQLASEFFSGLQTELHRADGERRQAFQEILQRRDAMITALSRADPQSGPMLAQLFTRYRLAMGQPVGPEAGAASSPQPQTPDSPQP
jgi:hypothetical protein